MKNCNQMIVAAVMGLSVSAFAFAQPAQNGMGTGGNAGGATPPTGTGAGNAGQTPIQSGPDVAEPDAMGNAANTQDRQMQGGMMGGKEADMKMMAQLDKIASMPDKANDALFVLMVANGNLFEVEAAKAAQQKSQNPKVKELAMMIEKDHAAANEKLKPIAQKMGLEFPTALPSEKQKMLAIAGSLSPQDFDTHYVLHNKAGHAKDITSFADHQKSVKDEDLRAYVSEVLPKLKEHGMMIQMAATEMGYPAPMGGGSMSGGGMGGMGGMTPPPAGGMTPAPGGGGVGNQPGVNPPTNNQNPSNR